MIKNGPWHARDNGVFDAKGQLIGSTSFERLEWQENAVLQAAAPEMAELLKRACDPRAATFQSGALDSWLKEARALLAQIGGKQ